MRAWRPLIAAALAATILLTLSASCQAGDGGRVDVAPFASSSPRFVLLVIYRLLDSAGLCYFSRFERRRGSMPRSEPAGRRLLVGVGALRTDDAVRLAQYAKAAGADAGLLAPVSFLPLD